MTAYFRFVLHHRALVIAACLLLTLLFGLALTRARIASSLTNMFMSGEEAHARYVERTRRFGADDKFIVVLPTPDLHRPDQTARIRELIGRIQAIDEVAWVDSLLGLPGGDGDSLDLDALRADPLASGLLLSGDGRHMAVVIELEPDEGRPIERTPALAGEIVELFAAAGYPREDLHLGGLLAVLAEIQRQTILNMAVLAPVVIVLLLATIWLLFRRLWPVLMTAVVAGLSIVWTVGFATLLEPRIDVLLAVSPALIVLIAFSDVVHLSSAYLREITAGRAKDDAILASAADVGVACLFTSLSTFVGFAGLALIDVPAFRRLGLVLGFGVAVALLLAMTLVPVMFSLAPAPKPYRGGGAAIQRGLDRLLGTLERAATARPWRVIAAFALVVVVSVAGLARFGIETDFVARMRPGNPLRRDAEIIGRLFSGSAVVDLFIALEPGAPLEGDVLRRLRDFEAAVEAQPEVGRVISALDVAPASPMGLTPAGSVAARRARFVDLERRELRMIVLLRETRIHAVYELGERVRGLAEETLGEGVATVEPSGFFYLAGRWLEDHVVSQGRALVITFLTIGLMMVLLFRSLSIGAWSMLPNAVPLLALGGLAGWTWGEVDSDLIIVVLVAIGIAVDDTIHLLARCRVEAARGAAPAEALHRAYGFAGRAIVMTSVIFAAGFAPFACSGYLSIRLLGLLLPFAMIAALLADLLLLPALITVGAIRIGRR